MRATRPVLATVDLATLAANLAELRRRLPAATAVIASVKANGYGHGAVEVAVALAGEGVEMLATGSFDEAAAIRAAGISTPILMLPGTLPAGLGELVAHGLTPTVSNDETAEAVARSGVPAWVKVDAGLGRLGVQPAAVAPLLRRRRDAASTPICRSPMPPGWTGRGRSWPRSRRCASSSSATACCRRRPRRARPRASWPASRTAARRCAQATSSTACRPRHRTSRTPRRSGRCCAPWRRGSSTLQPTRPPAQPASAAAHSSRPGP